MFYSLVYLLTPMLPACSWIVRGSVSACGGHRWFAAGSTSVLRQDSSYCLRSQLAFPLRKERGWRINESLSGVASGMGHSYLVQRNEESSFWFSPIHLVQ